MWAKFEAKLAEKKKIWYFMNQNCQQYLVVLFNSWDGCWTSILILIVFGMVYWTIATYKALKERRWSSFVILRRRDKMIEERESIRHYYGLCEAFQLLFIIEKWEHGVSGKSF